MQRNNKNMTDLIDARIVELSKKAGTLLAKEKATQRHHVTRDIRILKALKELLLKAPDGFVFSEEAYHGFEQLTDPAPVTPPIVVKEGDAILTLMQTYDGRKDLLKKLNTAADSAGLMLDFTLGSVVRKEAKPTETAVETKIPEDNEQTAHAEPQSVAKKLEKTLQKTAA